MLKIDIIRNFIAGYVVENQLLKIKKRSIKKAELIDAGIEEHFDFSKLAVEDLKFGKRLGHYTFLNGSYGIIKDMYYFITENDIDINNKEHLELIDMNFKNNKQQEIVVM